MISLQIVSVIFPKAASGVGIDPSSAAFSAASKFLSILTKEEINLYDAAKSSMTSFKKWRMWGPRFQKASVLGRKRRSTE
ncbi:hypothetical protein K1719_023711 [Acacia pycnantha]|nr:hypothetical protein K1719_023711 [Acacia pycnantha]